MSKETDFRKDYVKLYDRTDVEATPAVRDYIDATADRDQEAVEKHLAKLKDQKK